MGCEVGRRITGVTARRGEPVVKLGPDEARGEVIGEVDTCW